MHIMNILRSIRLPKQQILVFLSKKEFPSILVARQRTFHVLYLLFIIILQNIANILFDTVGEMKGPLLNRFGFEMILKSTAA